MATPSAQQARSQHARQSQIAAAASAAVAGALAKRQPWATTLTLFASYQLAAAQAGVQQMAHWMGGDPQLDPRAFAGVSSHGYPISEPLVATIDKVVPAPAQALPDPWWKDAEPFLRQVQQLIESEIQDAARSATQAEMTAHGGEAWVRVLVPPSCKRCAVLAGRIYRWSDGFQRHPQCFPAGVVASGPSVEASARRWYEGELVVLSTASGQELPLTGNHPVLTSSGWVPANLIQEGDYVVRSTRAQGASSLVVPDHDQMPSLVEDVWRALSVHGLDRMPSSAEDFHGDGQGGEVDVVYADGPLGDGIYPSLREHLRESILPGGVVLPALLNSQRMSQFLNLGKAAHASGAVGSGNLSLPLSVAELSIANEASLAHSAPLYAGIAQDSGYWAAADSVLPAQGVLAGTRHVGGHDDLTIQSGSLTRWDAPTLSDPVQQSAGYAAVGLDLLQRLSGQVELDRVVFSRSVDFRGHVYSLTSSEGWHTANSLIVSNCDCINAPCDSLEDAMNKGLVVTPDEAYRRGYIRDLTDAERKAIDDGADVSQVINSASGIYTATSFGTSVKATRTGTTKRAAWRRQNPSRLVRLRPEAIYKLADGDRTKAITLLQQYGYMPTTAA